MVRLVRSKSKSDGVELTYSASSATGITPQQINTTKSVASDTTPKRKSSKQTTHLEQNDGDQRVHKTAGSRGTGENEELHRKLKGIISRVSEKREGGELFTSPSVAATSVTGEDGSFINTAYSGGESYADETVRTFGTFGTFGTVGTVGPTLYRDGPIKPEMYVTAYLLQWKWAAEQGYPFLSFIMNVGAIGMIVTTLIPLAQDREGYTPFATGLLAAYSIIGSSVILILEFRFFSFRNPYGCRARIRNLITKNAGVLRTVWGRGWLAILVGLLQIAQEWDMTLVSGAVMVLIGIFAVIIGFYAAHKMTTLRTSLNDETQVWLEFNKHDRDNDGYINSTEFSYFISDIGMEYDDFHMLKAFNQIDTNGDQRITLRDFKRWWGSIKYDADFEENA